MRQLKLKYLDEGFYLSYYGFGLGTPRVSEKKQINTTLAKEFLLSFLGFDIIGGSHTRIKPGGGGNSFDEKLPEYLPGMILVIIFADFQNENMTV